MDYEYKCVGGPERPKRQRGVRGRSERAALAMQEIITAEAVDGWQYLRADLVPVQEKAGFLGRLHEVNRAVLIFRREAEAEARVVPGHRPHAVEPEPESGPQHWRAPSPDSHGRVAGAPDRTEPVPPARHNRQPPSDLG